MLIRSSPSFDCFRSEKDRFCKLVASDKTTVFLIGIVIQFSDSTRSTYSPCSCRRHQFLFNPIGKSEVFLRTSPKFPSLLALKLKIHDTRHMQVWCQKTSTAQSTHYSHFNQSKQDARKRQDRSPLERKRRKQLSHFHSP